MMPDAGTLAVVRIARSRPWQEPPRRERPRWLKAAALALGIVLAVGTAQWSLAQPERPRINVARSILAEPDSQTSLAIDVGPRDTLPNKSFLRLTGFPRSVSLTEGYAIAPGSWAVPLSALGSLKAIVPAGVSESNKITISLVGVDGITLAETTTTLVVSPPRILAAPIDPRPEPKRVAPAPPPPPAPTGKPVKAPDLSTDDRARAERYLALGGRHLEQGNIGAARSFFQRAAEAGLAAGAMKMAATYDPTELSRLEAVAVTPDRNEARKWYERARDLGARDAEERLARLGRN